MGCKLLPEGADLPPPAENAGASDAGATVVSGQDQRPKQRPSSVAKDDAAKDDAAVTPPSFDVVPMQSVEQKSKEELACVKQGGNWAKAGKSSGKTCLKPTRDAGKQCRKQGDCTSVCLARSGTCAPVKPLFGCNEILQKDGSRVTLCID